MARSESFEAIMLNNVQELIKKPLVSIPERYLQHHEQASSLGETINNAIPTINLNKLLHGEATELELEKLDSACREWGFFQLVEHGIESSVLEMLKNEVEEFFRLPLQEKMKYKVRQGEVEGYGSVILSEDQKLDWGDRMFMMINPLTRIKPHLLPQLPSPLRNIIESYIVEVQKLAMTLFELLAKALKIEKKEWEVFEDGMQTMRMTYYPPCPQPENVMGFNAHSDISGITILNQVNGVDGLQIKKDGIWIPVIVSSTALLVNIGDILEIMSNGAYKSVEHRATVNSEKERISIGVFFKPKFESEIGPSISLTSPGNPPLYERINMEAYVQGALSRKLDTKSYLEQMRIPPKPL